MRFRRNHRDKEVESIAARVAAEPDLLEEIIQGRGPGFDRLVDEALAERQRMREDAKNAAKHAASRDRRG